MSQYEIKELHIYDRVIDFDWIKRWNHNSSRISLFQVAFTLFKLRNNETEFALAKKVLEDYFSEPGYFRVKLDTHFDLFNSRGRYPSDEKRCLTVNMTYELDGEYLILAKKFQPKWGSPAVTFQFDAMRHPELLEEKTEA